VSHSQPVEGLQRVYRIPSCCFRRESGLAISKNQHNPRMFELLFKAGPSVGFSELMFLGPGPNLVLINCIASKQL